MKQLQCALEFVVYSDSNEIGQFLFKFSRKRFDYMLKIGNKVYDNYSKFKTEEKIKDMSMSIEITSEQQLSWLQIYLWQHKQCQFFNNDIKIIIKQEIFEYTTEIQYIMPLYWRQISTLAVQMGYNIISSSLDKYSQKLDLIRQNYDVFVFSAYVTFDTQILEQTSADSNDINFDSNLLFQQTNFILDEELFNQLKNLTYSILLQRLALNFSQNIFYCGLLPQVIGWNAYQISKIYFSKKQNQLNLNQQGLLQDILASQSLYQNLQDHYLPINVFVLPVHLLQYNLFNEENQFIFQQMCDVSYLFKAEFFAIYSYFKKFDNTVLSQSSRSGKTVTLHAVFYFNQLLGLKIPIYCNLGFEQVIDDNNVQILYNRSSIDITKSIKNLYQNFYLDYNNAENVTLSLIEHQIKGYYDYDKQMDEILKKICLSVGYYSSKDYRNKITSFYEIINKITSVNVTQLKSIDLFKVPLESSITNIDHKVLIMVDECLQLQNNRYVFSKTMASQLTKFYYDKFMVIGLKYMKNLMQELVSEQKQVKQSQDYITLIFDQKIESFTNLNQQKINIYTKILAQYKKENQKQQNINKNQKINDNEIQDLEYIQNLLDFYIITEKIDNIQFTNIKLNELFVKNISSDFLNKYKRAYVFSEQNFIMTFVNQTQQSLIQSDITQLLDQICILSPNLKNIKFQTSFQNFFYLKLKELQKCHCQNQFKQNLYNFIIILFNPRCIETIFWRNLFQTFNTINIVNSQVLLKVQPNIYQKLLMYFQNDEIKINQFQNYISNKDNNSVQFFFGKPIKDSSIDENSILNTFIRQYGILMAGTDMSLINFVRQQQGINSSTNSADLNQYILSNVIGGAQIHPTAIKPSYYFQCQINIQLNEQMYLQIEKKTDQCDPVNFYLSVIPELSGEIQFQCPLICPQLQILYEIQNQKYVEYFNNTKQFEFGNNQEHIILLQNQSYQSIIKSFVIEKVKDVSLSLMNGQLTQNIIIKKGEIYEIQARTIISNCTLDQFYLNLKIAASSNINRTSAYIYYYLITQRFIDSGIKNYDDKMMQLYFTTPQLSELSGALQFLVQLTKKEEMIDQCKKFIEDINLLKFYYSVYTKDSQINHNLDFKEVIGSISHICQDTKFMILLQTFDYSQFSKIDKQDFVLQAVNAAINCYKTIQIYQQTKAINRKKFIIMMKIDVPYLTNLHLSDTSVPDFILFFFGFEDHFQELSKISSPIEYTYNSQLNVLFLSAFESGNHCEGKLYQKISGSMLDFVIQASVFETYFKTEDRYINILLKNRKGEEKNYLQLPHVIQLQRLYHQNNYSADNTNKLLQDSILQYKSLINKKQQQFLYQQSSLQQALPIFYNKKLVKNQIYYQNIQFKVINGQQQFLELKNDKQLQLIDENEDNQQLDIINQYVLLFVTKIAINIKPNLIYNENLYSLIDQFIDNMENTTLLLNVLELDTSKYQSNLKQLHKILDDITVQNYFSLITYIKFSSFQQQLNFIQQQSNQKEVEFIDIWYKQNQQQFNFIQDQILLELNRFNYIILNINEIETILQIYIVRIDQTDVNHALLTYIQNKQKSIGFEQSYSTKQLLQTEILTFISHIISSQVENQSQIYLLDENSSNVVYEIHYHEDFYHILTQLNQNNIVITKVEGINIYVKQVDGLLKSREEYFIKQWIQQQIYQGDKIANYLQNYNYIDFSSLTLDDADLELFKNKKSITKLIEDLISLVNINEIELQVLLYDFYTTKYLKTITCPRDVDSIIKSLGNYIILKQNFPKDIKTIVFHVILIEQPLVSVQTPLQKINSWLSNHPLDYKNPHISAYLKTFKSLTLTEKIAKTANLQLFTPDFTINQQIQRVIDDANTNFKRNLVKLEAKNRSETVPLRSLTLDDVLEFLKNSVMIDYDLDVESGRITFLTVDGRQFQYKKVVIWSVIVFILCCFLTVLFRK